LIFTAIIEAEARKLDKVEVKSEQAQKPNSYVYMKNLDLGFDCEHIVHLSIHGGLHDKYDTIRDRFLQNPDALHVTASMALPSNIQSSPGTPEWEGKDPEAGMEIKARAASLFFYILKFRDLFSIFRKIGLYFYPNLYIFPKIKQR